MGVLPVATISSSFLRRSHPPQAKCVPDARPSQAIDCRDLPRLEVLDVFKHCLRKYGLESINPRFQEVASANAVASCSVRLYSNKRINVPAWSIIFCDVFHRSAHEFSSSSHPIFRFCWYVWIFWIREQKYEKSLRDSAKHIRLEKKKVLDQIEKVELDRSDLVKVSPETTC